MMTAEIDDVRIAKDKLRSVQQRKAALKADIESRKGTIVAEMDQLRAMRKAAIVADQPRDARYDQLADQLATRQSELRRVEDDLQDLLDAEPELQERVRQTEERATAQAAAALEGEIVKTARELDVALGRAERINERLLDLDAQLRQSGLAQAGGKRLILLARSGAAWSALDSNHRGAVPTLLGWRENIGTLLKPE
jgi:chromosome segregation ATPase